MKTKKRIRDLYAKIRRDPVSMLVGRDAEMALRAARIITRFEDLKRAGLVRISAEPQDESYFDVYGEPDTEKERKAIEESIERDGLWHVFTEYQDESGEWQTADSIGMCIYRDPCSPFENCYVVDLMDEAVTKAENAQREPAERAYWEARDVTTE
jgi:hypothetical protein